MSPDQPDRLGEDRPSDAVLDELLRAFEADELGSGRDIDLDSPEVEALLSGDVDRPRRPAGTTDPAGPEADEVSDDSSQQEGSPGPHGAEGESGGSEDPHAEHTGTGDDERPAAPVVRIVDDGLPAGASVHPHPEVEVEVEDETEVEGEVEDEVGASTASTGDGAPDLDGGSSQSKPPTVVIADDGLPDTVYVEGELDVESAGDRKANTVFIDDGADDIGEIVGTAEAERVTGIEPKLRERRIAVQRAEGRKRLRWFVALAAVLIVVIAGLAVLGSSLFSIDTVRVDGDTYSREALQPIVGDLEGEPVLRVDTGAYEDRIEQIPWVRQARVTTSFPGTARIEVAEREPLATFQGADGRYRVIDIEGRVLDVVAGQPLEYLLITTENPPNTAAGETAPLGFVNAGQLARYLTPNVRPMVDAIVTASDGTDTRLQLEGGTEVLLGDGQGLADKLVRLETVIRRFEGDLPAEVDVSTEEVTTSSG